MEEVTIPRVVSQVPAVLISHFSCTFISAYDRWFLCHKSHKNRNTFNKMVKDGSLTKPLVNKVDRLRTVPSRPAESVQVWRDQVAGTP